MEIARDTAARERIWKGRKAAFAAMGRVSPNYYVQDGVVPRPPSRMLRPFASWRPVRVCGSAMCSTRRRQPHPLICYDESIAGQAEHAEHVASEILKYVWMQAARCGEHGVGVDKKAYMPRCSRR